MRKTLIALAFALLAAGCSTAPKKTAEAPAVCPACPVCPPCPAVPVEPPEVKAIFKVSPENVPSFKDAGSMKRLLKAAELNLAYARKLAPSAIAYDFDGRKVGKAELEASSAEFLKLLGLAKTPEELDALVKERFDVYQLAGRDSTGTVVFSSYYEPTLEASPVRTDEYKYPIYAKPPDMVTADLSLFNPKFKGERISGMLDGSRLVPYLDRDAIDFRGALEGKGLELAWFTNRADIMDLHIEGSGRLQYPDGKQVKALFAATNSLKFKGWLTALVESGALTREGLSHEKGKEYIKNNPDKERAIMTANPRYTFFRIKQITDPEEGPDGTYGLPLVGWRSVAADNSLVPMGTLAFMRATVPDVTEEGKMLGKKEDSRFVFCQDTGGAIKGPGRIDYFAGHGKKARSFAFKLWDTGTIHLLLLKEKK
ncbi:MAG: MltA domain-containing protein [Elusimicrobiales bacterium]|nr:MltA domain-containing protein [Elusimicrobiales bacterium]